MREYKLWHLGAEYKIISLNDGEDIPKRLGRGIALVPDNAENYDLKALDIGACNLGRKEAKNALTLYFSNICGYPECTLDILLFGKLEKITVSSTAGTENASQAKKCKQIYTNTVVMNDLVELELTTLLYENKRVRIFECPDAESCAPDLSKLMLVAPGLCPADISVIFSQNGKRVVYPFDYEGEFIEWVIADYLNRTDKKEN